MLGLILTITISPLLPTIIIIIIITILTNQQYQALRLPLVVNYPVYVYQQPGIRVNKMITETSHRLIHLILAIELDPKHKIVQ